MGIYIINKFITLK